MPKARATLKQKTLHDFVEASSPTHRNRTEAEADPSSSPVQRAPRRRNAKAKGKAPLKPKFASSPPRRNDEGSGPDGGGSTSSDVGAIGFEPKVIAVSSSSDEEDLVTSPRSLLPRRERLAIAAESAEGSPIAIESDSDGPQHVGVPVTRNKNGSATDKRRHNAIQDTVKGVRPPTPEEHDSDLLEEVDSNKIIENRFRARGKKSAFEKNLERLKQRKLKQTKATLESTASASEENEESEENDKPFAGARPHTGDDSDASGFIEEDSVNAIAPELPAEFSMNTYQDLMHHFKIICQLFVHLAVQDPEDRQSFMEQSLKDQYFSVPLQIARRKLDGMKDSSVTSSVWKTSFKKPLEMYPDFETIQMDFASPGCDACNLGGRLSTIIGRVSGEPYDRTTFEPLESDESSNNSEDEEDEPKVKKEFNLGRFCARRTRVFHKFTHWEYALFKSLSQEVEDLKNRSTKRRVFVPVAFAGGAKPPDDLSDADGIMNWLDERGVISSEWHKIKEMMDNATNLEVASKRGDDVD
ncbi:hypothetical protein BC629DRAFT_1463896 [Irpex lacteus]|nr:hypothetical protein BC629DRAFT_1463896 [Irpex lacteus]